MANREQARAMQKMKDKAARKKMMQKAKPVKFKHSGGSYYTIDVDDIEDCISLNMDDYNTTSKLIDLELRLKTTTTEAAAAVELIDASDFSENSLDYIRAVNKVNRVMLNDMVDIIDDTFGEGVCNKVFGDILPQVGLLISLVSSVLPEALALVKEYDLENKDNIDNAIELLHSLGSTEEAETPAVKVETAEENLEAKIIQLPEKYR